MSEFVKFSVLCADSHPSTTIAVANNLGGFFATAGLLAQAQGLAANGRDVTVVCTPEAMDAFREDGDMAGIVAITSDSQLAPNVNSRINTAGAQPAKLLR